jgi:hypothetical protein
MRSKEKGVFRIVYPEDLDPWIVKFFRAIRRIINRQRRLLTIRWKRI